MRNLSEVGKQAEKLAADYLLAKGYTIVTRRYKARHGELDLVVLDGDLLVIVEVKHRRAHGYLPEDAMGDAKRKALVLASQQYLAEIGEPERELRFDLVAIDADGIRHHEDIFFD